MIRSYNVYPKNKIGSGISFLQIPLHQVNSFSAGKVRKYDCRPVFPKSKKIKKLIDEINSSNKLDKNINNNNTSNFCKYQKLFMDEKIKNKNLCENIMQLNNHIEELKYQLNIKCQQQIINDDIIMLKKENEELRIFKQKIYEISSKYDEVNKNILFCLKNIESAVDLFNSNYKNINSVEYKNATFNKISDNFNSIINNLNNFLRTKEDEYNILLVQKDNEIQTLKNKLSNVNNINKFVEEAKNNINENIIENNINNENIQYENNYQKNETYRPYLSNNLDRGNNQVPLDFNNTFQK